MTRFVRTLALMSALGLSAQEKKEKKSTEKATEKGAEKKVEKAEKAPEKKAEKAEAAGTIEYYQGKNGWRYIIKGADGKSIAMPLAQMSWETKEECIKAIAELKTILTTVKPTERKE
jgi:hypothetical protein